MTGKMGSKHGVLPTKKSHPEKSDFCTENGNRTHTP